MRARLLFAAVCLVAVCGCHGLSSKPGEYDVTVRSVKAADREIHATYVRPVQPRHPGRVIIFTTGDDGWLGTSRAVFAHLAAQGYTLVGFSAPEALGDIPRSDERVSPTRAAQGLKQVFAQAKQQLDLPDSTPTIVVGFSRGASVVAFAAVHPELRDDVQGAVAIALTREADYLRAPAGERRPEIQVDDQGRIQLYPTLQLLGSTPLAVIQSTRDSYVPAAESRALLGADTSTLRLYAVDAKDHGFRNARDVLMRDLDDALRWIDERVPLARQAP